jgi:hypothetical protein
MQEPDESQNVMNIMALQYMQTFLVHFRNPRYDVKIPSSTLFNWHYPPEHMSKLFKQDLMDYTRATTTVHYRISQPCSSRSLIYRISSSP